MAQDLSYVQTKVDERINDIVSTEEMARRPFMEICDPIVLEHGSDTLNTRMSYGSRGWEARVAGTPATKTELKSVLASTSVAAYKKNTTFEYDDPIDTILNWVTESVMGFLDAVDRGFWTILATANAIERSATPAISGLAATGGGKIYLADSFTVSPLNGGADFVQANAFSDTLTTAYLAAGLNARANWQTVGGDPDHVPGKPFLWHVNGVSDSVKTVLGPRTYSGGGLVGGYGDSVAGAVALAPGVTTSTTLWGLYFGRLMALAGQILRGGPVMPVLRKDFSVEFVKSTEDTVYNVLGFGSYGYFVHPLNFGDMQLHGIS